MGNICFKSNVQTIKVVPPHLNGHNSRPRLQNVNKKQVSRAELPPPPPPPPPSEPPSPADSPVPQHKDEDKEKEHRPTRLLPSPPSNPSHLPPPPTRLLPVTPQTKLLPETPPKRLLPAVPPKKPERKSKPKKTETENENRTSAGDFTLQIRDASDLTPIIPFEKENQPHHPAHREPVQIVSTEPKPSPKFPRPDTPAVSLSDHDGSRISVSNVSVRPSSLVSASIKSNIGLSLMELDDEIDDYDATRPDEGNEEERRMKRRLQEIDISPRNNSNHLGTEHVNKLDSEVATEVEEVLFTDVSGEDQLPTIPKTGEKSVHLPRDVYKAEMEKKRRRQQRKRRRERISRKKVPETPRIPKPEDPTSDGFEIARRTMSRDSLGSSEWSMDTFTYRADSRDSKTSMYDFDLDSRQVHRFYREGSNDSLLSVSSLRAQGSNFGSQADLDNSLTDLSQDDPFRDLNVPDGVPSETSGANFNRTKQKLLYSRYQRQRPVSESVLQRIVGKPPLPPGALDRLRPMSEGNINRSTQNYSRHFAEETILTDIN